MPARLHEQDALRLKKLEEELQDLKRRLTDLRCPSRRSEPGPRTLRRNRGDSGVGAPEGESYVASFVDANVNASGETVNDAVDNLKDMMVALLESLGSLPKKRLGKGPARQLAVLRAFIRKKG